MPRKLIYILPSTQIYTSPHTHTHAHTHKSRGEAGRGKQGEGTLDASETARAASNGLLLLSSPGGLVQGEEKGWVNRRARPLLVGGWE